MCGIVGSNFNQDSIKKALNLLAKRGPDSSNIKTLGSLTLAHSRLSIIDLSQRAEQPMSLGSLSIVFNGEIYNYKELAKAEGLEISNDTSILLHLYARYGVDFLDRLNGMFAFVIYDSQDDSYFGARDSFGKKPLFYYKNGSKFAFSSRISSIIEILGTVPKANLNALDSYLSFMSPLGEKTFYQDIFKLEASSYFTLKNGEFKVQRYCDLSLVDTLPTSFENAKLKSINLLKNSLNLRLNSDVPISFLLSGGLDSSMLCSLYSREFGKSFDTFSLGFDEYQNYDETIYAKQVSDFIGSNHHKIVLSKKDFFDIFDKFYEFCDEPLADSATIPTYHLSQKIHENGYKVAMSGEGSDECFMGYDLYFRVMEFYQKQLQKEDYPPISKDYEYLRRKELGLPIYGSSGEVFTRWQKEHLLLAYKPTEPLLPYQNSFYGLKQMSYMDFRIWVSDVLTTKIDRASMANSLEIRSPFLDPNLVKFSLSLPDDVKFKSTNKEILKSIAYSYLPKEIVERKKKGFSSPFIEWIMDDMGASIVDEILSINKFIPIFNEDFVKILYQKANNGRFKQHLWTLLHFAKWFKRWYV